MGLFTATISAVRKGLARTREALAGGLHSLLQDQVLSDALIDDIEDYLIKADVGVKATAAIIEQLRESFAAGDIA
ncbi:MAG: signal recognition particle receptor subunit alpha, partial [Planctomycetes bacterium]|nr:signal recognition particle receptor subunit alpha [Planctomycetota bacterium]